MPNFNWQALAEMAPLIVGALKPGSPEAGAMMRGYLASHQRLQEQQRQTSKDAQDESYRRAMLELSQQQGQRAEQTAQQESAKFFQDQFARTIEQQAPPEAPESWPVNLDELLAQSRAAQAQVAGIEPGKAEALAPLPNMSARRQRALRQAAAKFVDTHLEKLVFRTPEDRQLYEDAQRMNVGPLAALSGHPDGTTFTDIRAFAGAPPYTQPKGVVSPIPMPGKPAGTAAERAAELQGQIAATTDPAAKDALQKRYDRLFEEEKKFAALKPEDPTVTALRRLTMSLDQQRLQDLQIKAKTLDLPAGLTKELDVINTLHRQLGRLQTLGEQSNWAGTGGAGYGSISEFVAKNVGLGSKEGAELRSVLGQITSSIATLVGGLNLTNIELGLILRYAPDQDKSPLVNMANIAQLMPYLLSKAEDAILAATNPAEMLREMKERGTRQQIATPRVTTRPSVPAKPTAAPPRQVAPPLPTAETPEDEQQRRIREELEQFRLDRLRNR